MRIQDHPIVQPTRTTVISFVFDGRTLEALGAQQGLGGPLEVIEHGDEAAERVWIGHRCEDRTHRDQRIALEIQDRVHHVLEHFRPGDRPVLCHMSDEEYGDAGFLRRDDQPLGRLAYLAHAARR